MFDSVVVHALLVVAPIVFGGFVLDPCFVSWFLVHFLVKQSSGRGREMIA